MRADRMPKMDECMNLGSYVPKLYSTVRDKGKGGYRNDRPIAI